MNAAGSILLDTSVVIAYLRGDSNLAGRFEEADVLYLPWIVLGELQYGARRSRATEEALLEIADFQSIAASCFRPNKQFKPTLLLRRARCRGTPIPRTTSGLPPWQGSIVFGWRRETAFHPMSQELK